MRHPSCGLLAIALASALASACTFVGTEASVKALLVERGMTEQQVIDTAGPPSRVDSSSGSCPPGRAATRVLLYETSKSFFAAFDHWNFTSDSAISAVVQTSVSITPVSCGIFSSFNAR